VQICGNLGLFALGGAPAITGQNQVESTMSTNGDADATADDPKSGQGLGTFAGVFTPSILTILGIVLFLRLGYVIGGSGLERALIIIAIANAISILTSFSVAAISTNLRVKAGGDYYLISRTLGLGFGGAIGLVLFLAQAISVGFYCIGFAEVTAALFPPSNPMLVRAMAGSAVLGLGILAWLGSDWATRFQYVVMATMISALVLFTAGGLGAWNTNVLVSNWSYPTNGLSFGVAFAIFFPAVTGFTQGVSMSGDLANPSRSIPTGVFAAVALSIAVYFGCAFLLAGTVPGPILQADYLAMKRVALFGPMIDAGVIAATLSSALASFMGAPRILQSLARDDILPIVKPFAQGAGPSENPQRAVLLTAAIAAGVVVLGDLNLIASVVSMFFLISYGLLNYATYYEARAQSPSFRPTFRLYHPYVGLAGAVVCLGAMLAIDIAAGVAAAAILFGIYQYLELRAAPARWADSRRSHHLQEARRHLLAAAAGEEHPRDWRPQLLVFSDSSQRRHRLLQFAGWIEGRSGLTTVVRVLEGEGIEASRHRATALEELTADIKEGAFTAFPLVVAGEDVDQTISAVVQSAGIGPVRANTVIVNWSAGSSSLMAPLGAQRFSRNLRTAFGIGCNLIILDADAGEWQTLDTAEAKDRVIDVWWRPSKTGELMLLLAHLVTRSEGWQNARIRVLARPKNDENDEDLTERLTATLEEYRVDAEVIVSDVTADDIAQHSGESSLVFLPFAIRGPRFYGPTGEEVTGLLPSLPIVALVMAAQDVDLGADPDKEEDEEEDDGQGDAVESDEQPASDAARPPK
jgi:amino acid transporter